jgi:uncharacterized C2H2 Zn-finger protein
MSLVKIEAYKCEWCGRVFESDRTYHEMECSHDPKSRTCIGCLFSRDLKTNRNDKNVEDVVYCPRNDTVFKYPHQRYCADYKTDPNYEKYKIKQLGG